jgi:hypothetical protein
MKAYINKLKQWCKKIFQGYFFIGFVVSTSIYMPFFLYHNYNHKVEINNMKNDVEVILISKDGELKEKTFEHELESRSMRSVIESQQRAIEEARSIISGLVQELNKLKTGKSRSET